ncbi:hypothetical protein ACFL0D_06290, partial [Thermoproteota archaeon]
SSRVSAVGLSRSPGGDATLRLRLTGIKANAFCPYTRPLIGQRCSDTRPLKVASKRSGSAN